MGAFGRLVYSREYSELGDEAHKRGAVAVGAPSLVWHLGMFVENPIDPPHQEDRNVRRIILENARQILHEIDKRCVAGGSADAGDESIYFPPAKSAVPLSSGRVAEGETLSSANEDWSATDTETLFCVYSGILIKLIVEVHSDYITVTVIADFSKRPPDKNPMPDHFRLFDESSQSNLRAQADLYFGSYFQYVSGNKDEKGRQAAINSRNFFQDEFWNTLGRELFNDFECWANSELRVFADFRGIVLPYLDEGTFDLGEKSRHRQARNNGKRFTQQTQADALDRLLPIFVLGDPRLHMRELIACTMIGRRAVYVSPLGSTVVAGNRVPNRSITVPVVFAVSVADINRWQIGRLVQRINTLGTARLLALRDLQRIRKSSLEIRRIGRRVDEADNEEALRNLSREIDEVGAELYGGLMYRVYRSAFHASSFKNIVDDLRVLRIEGWQPYDEFVRRRLYSAYDFIGRVGDRLESLRNKIQRKSNILRFSGFERNTKSIEKIQKKIHDSHKVQHVIELIAVGYYGGYVVYYIMKSLSHLSFLQSMFLFKEFYNDKENSLLGFCLFGSLCLGIAWFNYRRISHRRSLSSEDE
ncbi:DUF3422 family protein [Oceaniradius stylonematis]|uniref:DUF3422 family protein n=1 Tax=Oceaniradius stylonematis TaxID=2184161 RepID=UPI00273CF5B8|nr:DUF3422 family protein [Oceaniradius stylonematis]